jgi:hypothetical protein
MRDDHQHPLDVAVRPGVRYRDGHPRTLAFLRSGPVGARR